MAKKGTKSDKSESSVKVKALTNIQYDGDAYAEGDTFEATAEWAEMLVSGGHAEPVVTKPVATDSEAEELES